MAFCGNCGAQLPEGALFCGKCGSKQPPRQPAAPEYAQPVQPEASVYAQPVQSESPAYAQTEQTAYAQPEQPVYTYPEQPVYAQPVQAEQAAYAQPVYEQPEEPKKKNLWKILLPIIGGVVLLALVVVLIIVLGKTHVESIDVEEAFLSLQVEDSYRVDYEVYPEEHDDEITWHSSDEDVATVRNGKIKAVGEGSCTIIVRAENGVEDELFVEVYDTVYVEEFYVDTTYITLQPYESYYVSWSVSPEDYTEAVTWTSSDESVATVSSDGAIEAVGDGSCYITLSAESGTSVEIWVDVVSMTEQEAAILGHWTSYGAYIDGESDYYYDMELYIYEDNTGEMIIEGETTAFEWFYDTYDYGDTECWYYDVYTEDDGYCYFVFYHDGSYAGDLDVCFEENFWVYFE